MSKPFSVLKLEVDQKSQNTSSSISNRIGNWMNQYYESLWKAYLWKEIVIIDQSVTFTSGTKEQLVPKNIDVILCITHRTTNAVLSPSNAYVYQSKYLSELAATADPVGYVLGGSIGIKTQPTSTGTISLVSNSSSDTTVCRVYGKDSNDYEINELVTLTGVSSVSTTKSYASVDNVVKTNLSTGEITIKDASSNIMDTISPNTYNNKYLKIHLNAVLGTNTTFFMCGKKRFTPLINDQDIPKFDCGNALIDFAVSEIFKIRGKFDQARDHIAIAEKYIRDLVTNSEVLSENVEMGLPLIPQNANDTFVHGGSLWV